MRSLIGKCATWLFASGVGICLMVIVSASPRAASADGGEIAYVTNDRRSIHLVQADGSSDRQLLAAGDLDSLAWAPGGKVLAYTTNQNVVNPPPMHIYLLDIASGRSTELKSSVPARGPIAFFPDAARLATTSLAARVAPGEGLRCDAQFLSIELATGRATPLRQGVGCVRSLQVAPDAAALIVSWVSGAPSAGVANLALPSGEATLIGGTPNDQGLPLSGSGVVAPDNRTVAYVARNSWDEKIPADLILADRDGSNTRVIWQGPLEGLAFSPDGTRLAVQRRDPDAPATAILAGQIWVIDTDGSNPRQIASGYNPVWRPGASTAPAVAAPAVAATAAPSTTPAQLGTGALTCHDAGEDSESGPFYVACEDGTGVVLDIGSQTVGMYDPDNPAGGIARGPWPSIGTQAATLVEWVDPDLNRTCRLSLGNRISTLDCTVAAPSTVAPQPATSQTDAPVASGGGSSSDPLADEVQGDILAAVDRANAAWTQAEFDLDTSVLKGAMAGGELAADQAQVAKLRAAGRRQKSTQLSYTVTGVTLDSPSHATVTTRESWSEEVDDAATGRVIQPSKSATYSETYIVELQDNAWIVTRNDVQPD